MSTNLEKAKEVAEELFSIDYKWIDIQEQLTEDEEKEFIEWQKNHPKWIQLPKRVPKVRLKKMKNKSYNN
jgi:hypothetical protein